MRVVPVPVLSDNYCYLLIEGERAAVVDPPVAEPVLTQAAAEGVAITQVWLTHHHWDHIGGVPELLGECKGLEVLGSAYDLDHGRIAGQTRALSDDERFDFEGHAVRVLACPGHTMGAISYLVRDGDRPGHLFSGDTLFLAGCGRLFEGTPGVMHASLAKLGAQPQDTRVWCGHEYTVANLEFAATVEPDSLAVAEALAAARTCRAAGQPTVPGTLGQEREVNPFLRCEVPEVALGRDAAATFAALRSAKDSF